MVPFLMTMSSLDGHSPTESLLYAIFHTVVQQLTRFHISSDTEHHKVSP